MHVRVLSLLFLLWMMVPQVSCLSNPHNHNGDPINNHVNRRGILQTCLPSAAAAAAASLHVLLDPISVSAATPLSKEEWENDPKLRFERQVLRPRPNTKLLRPRLNQDFAVLLMRSSYNALDEMDVVAMDQFQRDFFLVRQAEYETYVNGAGGPGAVRQGMLDDPLYFDFISFAQYATISRELSGGVPLFFTEQQPDPQSVDENGLTNKFVSVVVQRKPEYTARDVDFAQVHSDLVGSAIIDRLKQTFGGTPSALPLFENGKRPSASVVEQALKQLVNLFLINGFALDGSLVSSTTNSSNKALTFEIRFISPANLWSGQALEIRKSKARNNFVGKAAKVLLSDAGFTVTTNVKYTKTDEITTIYLI